MTQKLSGARLNSAMIKCLTHNETVSKDIRRVGRRLQRGGRMLKSMVTAEGNRTELEQFAANEEGVATVFACFMIMMMVLVGGIGVDLMHSEMERTRLQNTLDRAVLAAADMDQTLDPNSVVTDYFAKSGMSEFLTNVEVDQSLNHRTVTAEAETLSNTAFMNLMGVDQLRVPAVSSAEERISNVEVSLIVDVSGSMAWNSKMENLQDAANTFVETLIQDDTQDLISINLVPYSEHVNVGWDIFSQLNVTHRHNYSYCLEIPDAEFENAALDTAITYDQMQHFQWNWGSSTNYQNVVDDTVCPSANEETILPMSQSVSDLQARINAYQPRAGTSIFMAVKWGAALLDPSTRSIVTSMVNSGTVDSAFSGRPADYDDADTLKTMVVMTDGKNDRSYRIQDWAYRTNSHIVHWSNYNFWFYLNYYVNSYYYSNFYQQKYNATQGDALTDSICTAAKDAGIVIWGVGFEVDDHGADVLEDCASSPSHFFRVEGIEISEAFTAIASQINQLRLTQ